MIRLRLAPDLALPPEAVTETFGILAARGAGKSNTAAVMAEEMFRAKLPFVVVDPVRCWWGLRSSRDGTGPGLPIPIFGGRRGDVPLERGGGPLVADLVVDQRLSCVLDLSDFESEGAKKQFLLDFARRLYQRNEAPLHLFLEEADDYIPQRPMGRDEPFLLRAWENIVRRGRARGLGCTLITQRSAALNKNVLTQVQTLIPMRTTGPQDIAAIREWVKYHHQGEALLESLPGLEDGEGWVWSPHFLKRMVRVRFRLRETFDSGATPKASASPRPPATLADVDLGQLKAKMAATIERAKQEDPWALRARIAELERERKAWQKAAGVSRSAPAPTRVEVPMLKNAQVKRLEVALHAAERLSERVLAAAGALTQALKTREADMPRHAATWKPMPPAPRAAPAPRSASRPAETRALPRGERLVLTAIAQYPGGVTRDQLTVLTGYRQSTRNSYVQRASERGYVTVEGDRISATPAGLDALGDGFEPLPTGDALLTYWLARLPTGERSVLEIVARAYPEPVGRDAISHATDFKPSTRNTYLQRLGARRLVVSERQGRVRASAELFGS